MSTTKTAKAYIVRILSVIVFNTLVLTCLVIATNCKPDAYIENLFGLVNKYIPFLGLGREHKFSDTTIVKNIYVLNAIYLVILVSGAINLFLIYIQIVEPTTEAEAEAEVEDAKKEDVKDEAEALKSQDNKDEAEADTNNISNA